MWIGDSEGGALALLRSCNFHLVVATQSLADIDLVDPTLAESIMTNTNTLICLKINSATEADRLAKRFGTHTAAERTMWVSQGQHTGESSMRYNESYIVHPNDLKGLTPFTAYVLRELAQPKADDSEESEGTATSCSRGLTLAGNGAGLECKFT
jgi:type IV secretory pathway TraG/TraD family ATPase VirD4